MDKGINLKIEKIFSEHQKESDKRKDLIKQKVTKLLFTYTLYIYSTI